MSKARTLLERLIREVKRHMVAVIVAAAIFFMTLGFYVIFEQPQYKIWGAIGVVIGLIFWLVALLCAYWREKKEHQKRIEEKEQQEARWLIERTESQQLNQAILTELKKLNKSKESKE
jgi:Na+/melibiose symporter-like transporter